MIDNLVLAQRQELERLTRAAAENPPGFEFEALDNSGFSYPLRP